MRCLLAFLGLWVLAGCGMGNQEGSRENPEASVAMPASAEHPHIIVRGTEITYNGQPLKFGDTLEEWERVIGGQGRVADEKLTIVRVWDSVGLLGYRKSPIDPKKGTIMKTLSVMLEIDPFSVF
ncbi:MAG: hypothetical protein LBI31_03240, partial [Zoogloeaceae bacterium]|nr:hypothetical protein [Zoogloeaceae bacterium]